MFLVFFLNYNSLKANDERREHEKKRIKKKTIIIFISFFVLIFLFSHLNFFLFIRIFLGNKKKRQCEGSSRKEKRWASKRKTENTTMIHLCFSICCVIVSFIFSLWYNPSTFQFDWISLAQKEQKKRRASEKRKIVEMEKRLFISLFSPHSSHYWTFRMHMMRRFSSFKQCKTLSLISLLVTET